MDPITGLEGFVAGTTNGNKLCKEQLAEEVVAGQTSPKTGETETVRYKSITPSTQIPIVVNGPIVQSLHAKDGVGAQAAPPSKEAMIVLCVTAIEPYSQVDPDTGVGEPSKQSLQGTDTKGVQAAPLLEAVLAIV